LLTAVRQLLPHGWSIHSGMVVSLSESSRSVTVAPYELPSMRTAPEVVSSASVASFGNSASIQVLSPHPGAGSNPNVASQSGAQVLVQSQAMPPRRTKSLMPLMIIVATLGMLALATVGYSISRDNQPAAMSLPAPSPAPTQPPTTSPTPEAVAVVPIAGPTVVEAEKAMRKGRVMIIPPDAQVELNGQSTKAVGGYLDLEGKLGTEFTVQLRKGNYKQEYRVVLVESGAFPTMINLLAPNAGATRTSTTDKLKRTF
jgi:hypothetical protein